MVALATVGQAAVIKSIGVGGVYPDRFGVIGNRAVVIATAGGDIAIEACTRLLKSGRFDKRNLALIYSNPANQWERKGDLDKAMQDHGEAIRTDATYAAGYMHRGNAYAGDGDEGGYHDPCGDFGPGGRSDLVSLEHAARGA